MPTQSASKKSKDSRVQIQSKRTTFVDVEEISVSSTKDYIAPTYLLLAKVLVSNQN